VIATISVYSSVDSGGVIRKSEDDEVIKKGGISGGISIDNREYG
jgi:hypothetical protein